MVYTMQPPDELLADTYLPAMRHLVALNLRSRGYSQSAISSILGVTQASVSLYLSSDPARSYRALSRFSVSQERADRDSAFLTDAAQKGAADGVRALHGIWTGLLGSGAVCPAHREKYGALSDCDFCIGEYGRRRGEVSEAIAEVAEAVRLIERSHEFAAVVPEVSVNIACAAGDAKTPAEVVAIPGRIVRVKDRARALLPPEAGASVHMSKILILARKRNGAFRAVINLRYDSRMAQVMRVAGLKILTIGKHSGLGPEDSTAEALQRVLDGERGPFDSVVDLGGSGIEPNVYIFARGAMEAARLAIRLARSYSST